MNRRREPQKHQRCHEDTKVTKKKNKNLVDLALLRDLRVFVATLLILHFGGLTPA